MEDVVVTKKTDFQAKDKPYNDLVDRLERSAIGNIFVPILHSRGITANEMERVLASSTPSTISQEASSQGKSMTVRRWFTVPRNKSEKPSLPSVLNLYKLCVLLDTDFDKVCTALDKTLKP